MRLQLRVTAAAVDKGGRRRLGGVGDGLGGGPRGGCGRRARRRATGRLRATRPRQATVRPNPVALCFPPPRHPLDPEPRHRWSYTSDGRYRSVVRGGDGDGGCSVVGGSRVAQASAKPRLPPGAWPNCSVVRWRSASAAVLQIPSEEANFSELSEKKLLQTESFEFY
uniref:Uncharacterized protein n=1 Tax=Oryza meridionalis TaxID=40149 RepID=A0A0E0F7U5_9ORYZ